MYKAIIVDDEPWTIIDIEKTFCLEDMGFEIIGSYRTPQKALPAIVSKKPDLVITDIRMPGMTGLELIKSVREQNVNCEFIIVSGHSDFSYAQEAISYGVAGYCLKPLEPQKTAEALNRAKRHLDSRKTTAPELSYLDDNFESLRNYMITHFSEKLTLKSLAAEFNMNPNYCCSLFTKYSGRHFQLILQNSELQKRRICFIILIILWKRLPPWLVLKITFILAKYLKNTVIILQRNIAIFHTKTICLRGLMSL